MVEGDNGVSDLPERIIEVEEGGMVVRSFIVECEGRWINTHRGMRCPIGNV